MSALGTRIYRKNHPFEIVFSLMVVHETVGTTINHQHFLPGEYFGRHTPLVHKSFIVHLCRPYMGRYAVVHSEVLSGIIWGVSMKQYLRILSSLGFFPRVIRKSTNPMTSRSKATLMGMMTSRFKPDISEAENMQWRGEGHLRDDLQPFSW